MPRAAHHLHLGNQDVQDLPPTAPQATRRLDFRRHSKASTLHSAEATLGSQAKAVSTEALEDLVVTSRVSRALAMATVALTRPMVATARAEVAGDRTMARTSMAATMNKA